MSGFNESGNGRRGGGHNRPAHLKGKEIGLYYRDRAKKRREENGSGENVRLNSKIDIPDAIQHQITDYLHKFSVPTDDNKVSVKFIEDFQRLITMSFDEFILGAKKQLESDAKISTTMNKDHEINDRLLADWQNKQQTSLEYRKRWEQRQSLPAIQQSDRILKMIQSEQVVLVVGATGCGKTTQIPQLLLDDMIAKGEASGYHIVCTQPRRISAITVAERVAYERDEKLGESVGYQIRLESQMPSKVCSILYCTTGIILQKMQTDPLLSNLKVLILDEVHERSVETDLLMGILKLILPHRPDLKLILMSATISEQVFCEYFQCRSIYIEGTLYPVEMLYLEDILQETGYTNFDAERNNRKRPQHHFHGSHREKLRRQLSEKENIQRELLFPFMSSLKKNYDDHVINSIQCPNSEGCENLEFLEYLIFYITKNKPAGAILTFLPSYSKISKLNDLLKAPSCLQHKCLVNQIEVYVLHSMMPTMHQVRVFQPAPEGKRKVILSTIIAETSVTIDDVVYVINPGRTKNNVYNVETNIQSLTEEWVSEANNQQRRGRAGRVQAGVCYNLFTRARQQSMDSLPTPDIIRSQLGNIVLCLKLLHLDDPLEFLETLITPPHPKAIRNGINLLKRINALNEEGVITPLGVHLARLPIEPQMAKMILMAALFRCLDPVTSIAAGISYKSPFYCPLGLEKRVDKVKQDFAGNMRSDHLLLHKVIEEYRLACNDNAVSNFCYDNFLSIPILKHIECMKQQFASLLNGASFTESSDCLADSSNVNSSNIPLLRAVISAGLYPNIAFLSRVKQIRNRVHAIHKMCTPEDRRINFHPSSVNCGKSSFSSHFFVYFQKQRTADLYMFDSTMVFPMALLIFGDGVKSGFTAKNIPYISVANEYYFKCHPDVSKIILNVRECMILLLQKKALYPSPIKSNSSDAYLIKAIELLLSLQDNSYDYDNYESDNSDNDE